MDLRSHRFSQNTNKKLSRFLPSLNRAEILTIFRSYYGRNDDFLNWFWNCLTFSIGQNHEEDFFKLCVLLRKSELYPYAFLYGLNVSLKILWNRKITKIKTILQNSFHSVLSPVHWHFLERCRRSYVPSLTPHTMESNLLSFYFFYLIFKYLFDLREMGKYFIRIYKILKYYSPTVADGKTFVPVFCVLWIAV